MSFSRILFLIGGTRASEYIGGKGLNLHLEVFQFECRELEVYHLTLAQSLKLANFSIVK